MLRSNGHEAPRSVSLAINCQSMLFSGRSCVLDCILIICEYDILQTACGNFTKFTALTQLSDTLTILTVTDIVSGKGIPVDGSPWKTI